MQGCTLEVATLATNFAWLLNNSWTIPKDSNTINIKLHDSWHIHYPNTKLTTWISSTISMTTKRIGLKLERNSSKGFFHKKTYNAKISYGVKCPVCSVHLWGLQMVAFLNTFGAYCHWKLCSTKVETNIFWKLTFE